MYHSIDFDDRNTWTDWHLVPTSRPVITPPEVKNKTIDIPGANGVLDLTDSLTKYPIYGNRTGSFEFMVVNDFYQIVNTHQEWHERYSEIMNYLHGQRMKMRLEDDPDWWYFGRFKVDSWSTGRSHSTITISYDLDPFKIYDTVGIKQLTASSSTQTVYFYQTTDNLGDVPITPRIQVSGAATGGVEIRFVNSYLGIDVKQIFRNGLNDAPRFVFYGSSSYRMEYKAVSGSANISVTWQKGSL